jgi:16S rRNA (cytosine1402-N4)-methyltransferase
MTELKDYHENTKERKHEKKDIISSGGKTVFHIPVMVKEVITHLLPISPAEDNDGKLPMYIDATLGGGGHSKAILEKISNGIVIGLDIDNDAIEFSKKRLKHYTNFHLFHTSYTNIDQIVQQFPDYFLQGVLFDLGVSYHQIATPERGFSYNADGPLDMRFDRSLIGITAQQIIQRTSTYELVKIFSEFGEEHGAHKIANYINAQRNQIKDTTTLANIIKDVIPIRFQNKTLSRIFQALRIVVNAELDNVKIGLQKAIDLLAKSARLIVISYHSLEDRITKQMFREQSEKGILNILTKKPLRPELVETTQNPSSRSAKLRVAEKL